MHPIQNTALEARVHSWKQQIEQHYEVINTIDLRDASLLQTVTTLIANVNGLLVEVEHVERTESKQEVERYVYSIGALRFTLSHVFVALQNAGQTLGAIHPLAPLERGASLRQLEEPFFD